MLMPPKVTFWLCLVHSTSFSFGKTLLNFFLEFLFLERCWKVKNSALPQFEFSELRALRSGNQSQPTLWGDQSFDSFLYVSWSSSIIGVTNSCPRLLMVQFWGWSTNYETRRNMHKNPLSHLCMRPLLCKLLITHFEENEACHCVSKIHS